MSDESMVLDTKDFYNNLNFFHDKTNDIINLIDRFMENSRSRRKTLLPKYAAARVENGKVVEMCNFYCEKETPEICKEILKYWMQQKHKHVYLDDIYKLELNDRVFLFKVFIEKNNENNFVVAGYIINNSVTLRSFMTSLNENTIQQKYEHILSMV